MIKFIQRLKPWQLQLTFLFIAIIIRSSFFFRDYIDHDESTFILMGQALVDGHLPYTTYWDLKPPLVFYTFAGIIATFGKSIIAIRLIGSIVVGLTAWFTYKLGKLHFSERVGFYAGLICIYTLSLFGAMQGVMSEHLAALPLVAGIYFLSKKESHLNYLMCGFLFGAAIMFRLNLAYAIFFVYAYILFYKGFDKTSITKAFILTFGSLIAFLLCFIPYILTDNISLLRTSVFEASIAYSDVSFQKMMKTLPLVISFLIFCGLSVRYLRSNKNQKTFMIIIVMIIGQSFMFFKSGKINGHYLIQVFPFLTVLLVAFVSKIKVSQKLTKYVASALLVLFILLPIESYLEVGNVVNSYRQNKTPYNGEGHTIPAYLIKNYGTELPKNILFLNEHIGYWILNTMPPTAISMHPSNITRETAYPFVLNAHSTPLEELTYILEKKRPNFIIYDERRNPMPRDGEVYQYLQRDIHSNYTLDKSFGDHQSVKVFKLNEL